MQIIRFLLFPFAAIYWCVTIVRNKCFDSGIFKSNFIQSKSITIGNLSLGGTGKSPHLNYIIDHLLTIDKNVSTLSRGYGRKTKGLIEGTANSSSEEIGDEPAMYLSKHRASIHTIVSEDRWKGVQYIENKYPQNDVILLDDAYQHRKVKSGLTILVTEYDRPYDKDWIFPVGRLRESKSGAKRADIIIISKCPESLSLEEKKHITTRINKGDDNVFFSSIQYDELHPLMYRVESVENILLVTGIGNPLPLLEHLSKTYYVEHIKFPDHHQFSLKDIEQIHKKFDTFASRNKIIVTTEKDFMRLKKFQSVFDEKIPWFTQPIKIKIHDELRFNALITNYVS